jgi:hypothetical protein
LASLHECWPGGGFFLCQGLFFRDYGGLDLVHFTKWMTHQGKPEFLKGWAISEEESAYYN